MDGGNIMLSPVERRKFTRVNVPIPLQYKNARSATDLFKECDIIDLSQGGLRFTTDQFAPLACHMVVKIVASPGEEPVRAISKIAWVKRLSSGNRFEVGGEFKTISEKDAAIIAGLIKKYQNNRRINPSSN